MFFKSLQLKMILILFMFTTLIIIGVGLFSTIKIEEIYYQGFVEEMLNTIQSFGININDMSDSQEEEPILEEEQMSQETLNKIYNNFSIYFSLNNISRNGKILNNKNEILFASGEKTLSDKELEVVEQAKENSRKYAVYDDISNNRYLFSYPIEYKSNNETIIEYIILIEQSKSYIQRQLNEIRIVYIVTVIGISLVTIIIAISLSNNITKPIDNLTRKVKMIADGNIEKMSLPDAKNAGYEISKLVETFNFMTLQIRGNLNEISSEKNKLETILLHLTDGVLAFNIDGNMIHANLAAKKMFQLDGVESFDEIFNKLKIDINFEKIMYLEDWTSSEQMVKLGEIYVNMFFASFRNEQDSPSGVVVVVQDTTEQAKLDNMRKEFVANVSHELKTPLTSIKTYAETLIEGDLDEESNKRFLNVILTEANRMGRLVSDLLQLSKFDYKKIAWNKINFDLTELVKQICEKHKIQAVNKEQSLENFVTSNVPEVYADRDGIEQVVTNILTNSIKYTPEKGVIKVYVGSVYNDAYIKIIDNGIGIPKDDLPRVFERFYRVDKARSREMGGTGLGLPIAKEIIEANGGSIDMKSNIGKGTEVIIKIPIYKQ